MTDSRPDPDQLLAQLREDEAREARGRLRIYFGSSAGVGKTYAMLAAARKLQAEGVDVLAGLVETHGRAETAALLLGLPQLPRAQLVHGSGRSLEEFDLDAALARRPALLLVDELAHSNARGSRHPKRWQDVEELLDAGIDVWTTLNVQHLESLNDVVGGIAGIRVHETLPDTFFDRADEVVLVDTPADELIARLAAGKVYLPAQAERAAANFFRKGNLMALRELALRRTADRVEGDVQAWRVEQAIAPVWKTEAALLCCVGPREDGDHLVRSAARLAQQLAVAWQTVYVETPALQRLPAAERQRILGHLKLAEDLGATTAVLTGRDVASALVAHARRHNLSKLLVGHNRPRPWWRRETFTQRLARLAPDVDLIEIGEGQRPAEKVVSATAASPEPGAGGRRAPRYLGAVLACGATVLVALGLQPWFDLVNIVMLFLLAVVGVALRFGRGPAVLAAVLGVASFDFFFVAPQLSFAVSDVQYLLTFVVMLIVGLVVGQLTAGLRFEAEVARDREARSRALFELARELSGALQTDQAVAIAEAAIGREFRACVKLLTLGEGDRLAEPEGVHDDGVAPLDVATAAWVLDRSEPAGIGTATLPGSAWLYLPLVAPMRTRGVLALRPFDPGLLLAPEQRRQLDTFTALAAHALERLHYVEVAQQATVQIESERLRNSLLAALSHDLRTPLAALYGLADTLAASLRRPVPDAAVIASAQEAAQAIGQEARRLNAMVANLLDMARLRAGGVPLALAWQPFEEVVGSARRALRAALARHPITTDVPADLPLVNFDAALIERVLCNLLENAVKYTPPGTPIAIAARAEGEVLRVTVSDQGPGLPAGREEALFETFARGERESTTPGVGLGLSICRAIVEAHGGRIRAERPLSGRGARIVFTLPLGVPPESPGAEEASTAEAEGARS